MSDADSTMIFIIELCSIVAAACLYKIYLVLKDVRAELRKLNERKP